MSGLSSRIVLSYPLPQNNTEGMTMKMLSGIVDLFRSLYDSCQVPRKYKKIKRQVLGI
jgi:hypothetical protein